MEFTYLQFYFVFAVLVIHFMADFIFQTDNDAKNKSKCNLSLTSHVIMYLMVTVIFYSFFIFWMFPEINDQHILKTAILVYIGGTHWGTDWITSRINSRLYKAGKIHLFFVSVGADQLIHFVSLFGIFFWISSF